MSLQKELENLLNRHSRENESDTPDFVLAEYMMRCLSAFECAVQARDRRLKTDVEHLHEIIGSLQQHITDWKHVTGSQTPDDFRKRQLDNS